MIDLNSFITLHYRIEQVIDGAPQPIVNTFGGTPVTLTLGQGQLSPILEAKLIGLTESDEYPKTFEIQNAFGERDMKLVRAFSIDQLQNHGIESDLTAGDLVRFNLEHLPQQKIHSEVATTALENMPKVVGACFLKYEGDVAFFDFNHPLAGETLIFTVEVLSIL